MQDQANSLSEVASGYKQDIESAKNDLQIIRGLLGAFGESRTTLSGDVDGLQSQLRSSNERAERAERELQQRKSELEQVQTRLVDDISRALWFSDESRRITFLHWTTAAKRTTKTGT